jgi:hypothetical protein
LGPQSPCRPWPAPATSWLPSSAAAPKPSRTPPAALPADARDPVIHGIRRPAAQPAAARR